MKKLIKKVAPRGLLHLYHLALAYAGAIRYGFPTRRLVVIGVTGTRGKTTTANLIWSILTAAGYTVGLTGTANIRVGSTEELNPYHMTMPGRFAMHALLARMVRAGCEIAVVETPSEGIEQYRHRGITYDAAVLTSLYPEYLETHGWNYDRLKSQIEELFASLAGHPHKKLRGAPVPKTMVIPAGLEDKARFLTHPADKKILYGTGDGTHIQATNITSTAEGVRFVVDGKTYGLKLVGSFNVENALAAIALARALGIPDAETARGLARLETVPGRMEAIGTGRPFTVFVDYAHDGPSIEAACRAAREIAAARGGRVVLVLGGEGGGRDKKKRPIMGECAARLADIVVVSNVDPYDDDPVEIIEDIARASERAGKVRGKNLFTIEDRRSGIRMALELAAEGDVVLITGKGAEQALIVGPTTLAWDDRTVTREELTRQKET
ncbi:UDP-N-acetylmuramyl-tripeptide synthetase [Candidatus Uhrbacteria bacterium]|nr:UDP-N-acetylmuramyl-tripeptide synthetase [Candidatus Uhrbacteria bacterium]